MPLQPPEDLPHVLIAGRVSPAAAVRGVDDLLGLSSRVHESVAAVQQALLWGFDVQECVTLAIDAVVEVSGSTWGAIAVRASDPQPDPLVRVEGPRGVRLVSEESESAWLDRVARQVTPIVETAVTARSPVTAPFPDETTEASWRSADDAAVAVLPVPGATSSSRAVVLVRRAGAYDMGLVRALDPLVRLLGQMDAWAGEVEARRAAERALAQERRRLELALAASEVGVIEFDPASGALQWDARTWAMHGLEPREPWGLPDWVGLLHPEDAPRALADLMASLGEVASRQTQHRIVRPDGEVRHIRSHVRTFTDAERARVVGVSIDVTADVSLQLELAAERAQAEAATQAKSQFLATMSHEVRTPMNGVLGMLELLLRDGLSPEQHERAETAHASAACLLRILDDILDLSKLEHRQVALEALPYEPRRVIGDAVALLQPRVDEKGLVLVEDVDPALPAWLRGDATRVRQVLLNLAGNAVKFTATGEVRICARVVHDDAASPRWRVEVRDTGEGIAEDVQARLFQRFVQADSSTSRRFGGTGLGLAISRQLVELMGGVIGVTSRPGAGSCFWFELPAVGVLVERLPDLGDDDVEVLPLPDVAGAGDGVCVPRPDARDETTETPSLRVLAVDDNAVNRRVVQAFLATAGHHAAIVDGGDAALALLAREAFDVVLMDVQMPGMDGPTCLRHIRALERPTRDVPVVALTANAMAGDRERYLAEGFTDYVSKPMTIQSLTAAIARVYRNAGNAGNAANAGNAR